MALFVLTFGIPVFVFFAFLYRKTDKPRKYSKGTLVLLLLSIIVNVALAQNYTESLLPFPVNDGIGISNSLAFLVIGDENWSKELFKLAYAYSTAISVGLLVIYAILLVIEKNQK